MRKVHSVRFAPFVLKASLLACAVLGACGGGGSLRYLSQGTPTAPEASALIVADVDGSSSTTRVNLKVERLPPPDRLGGTSFVAWAKPGEDDRWHRLGTLSYDTAMHQGALFDASVAKTSFDLVISAEGDDYTETPSSMVVISQNVAR